MTIKTKLTFFISSIVAVILALNLSINYFTSRDRLLAASEQQMNVIARQIAATIQTSEQARQFIEEAVADKLRQAALAAKYRLDPDIANVTNEQLAALCEELGIDGLTLWQRKDDDIVAVKSSDPKEIGMSAKSWDYWYDAFNQLFDLRRVSVGQGYALEHFWSGPINFATSDPSNIIKWGNYYDGTTNYMINPMVHADVFFDFERYAGTETLLRKWIYNNPDILEITGFDPEFVGKAPILKLKQGQVVHNLDVRAVLFGPYQYEDKKRDVGIIHSVSRSGEMSTVQTSALGKRILKSFVPIDIPGRKPIVIGITMDRSAMEQTLARQLLTQGAVSLALFLASVAAIYILVGFFIRPLGQIVERVNEIAAGHFGSHIPVRSRDELGLLASRINAMSDNLHDYLNRLTDSAKELQGTKEYLESFINHTTDAIHVEDPNGTVVRANKAFETIFGWKEHEIAGKRAPIIPPEQAEEHERLICTIRSGGTVADYETIRLTRDGRPIDVSVTISPICDSMGQIVGIATISRNITQRKQTEEMLRRSEKLTAIGQLAAGVAHEIRNPLTTLRGFIQLLQTDADRSLSKEHIDIMLSEMDRIHFIVSEFLVLAKPQAVRFQQVDLAETLRDLIVLMQAQAMMSGVRLELKFDKDVPAIEGEPNQLKQVFLNILKNAIEAMPDGGRLLIELKTGQEGVVVRCTDEGVGIPAEELPRLGEPFYTSKPNGNGLGLMVSQQIISNHKGVIRIESEPGQGTCVEIRLPLANS